MSDKKIPFEEEIVIKYPSYFSLATNSLTEQAIKNFYKYLTSLGKVTSYRVKFKSGNMVITLETSGAIQDFIFMENDSNNAPIRTFSVTSYPGSVNDVLYKYKSVGVQPEDQYKRRHFYDRRKI